MQRNFKSQRSYGITDQHSQPPCREGRGDDVYLRGGGGEETAPWARAVGQRPGRIDVCAERAAAAQVEGGDEDGAWAVSSPSGWLVYVHVQQG